MGGELTHRVQEAQAEESDQWSGRGEPRPEGNRQAPDMKLK